MSDELNLIPPHRRRMLDKQSALNNLNGIVRTVVQGLVVMTIIGAGTILVLQTLIFTASQSSVGELEKEIGRFKDRREDIARHNQKIAVMHDVSAKRVVWSDFMSDLLTIMPSGVRVQRINGRVADQRAVIEIDGQAVNRNTLLALNERLESLPWVDSVVAPHTNLLGRINPEFSFTLELKR